MPRWAMYAAAFAAGFYFAKMKYEPAATAYGNLAGDPPPTTTVAV